MQRAFRPFASREVGDWLGGAGRRLSMTILSGAQATVTTAVVRPKGFSAVDQGSVG